MKLVGKPWLYGVAVLALCSTAIVPLAAGASAKPVPHVAFFGFASNNSFAQATWQGVQKAVKADHGTATFLNPNFSATTQVQQMQTAIVSGKYNIFVVQANDGSAVVPVVKAAIKKGIVVVAEFTQIGKSYSTVKPQVPGVISVVENSVKNGTDLGAMAISACGTLAKCNVVYMQGSPALPLDVARTAAVLSELKTDSNITLVGDPVGGYAPATGESVTANLLTTNPNINVIIGSSQAVEGATITLQNQKLIGKVQLIGNGGSTQAVNFVQNGTWHGTFGIPEVTDGYIATKYGIEKLDGGKPPLATDSAHLGSANGIWTRDIVLTQNIVGQYKD
jgi:ribose transport system substrate-binding protein